MTFVARAAGVLVPLALLVGGCAGSPGADPPAHSAHGAAPTSAGKAAQALTVQQLGDVLGCRPKIMGKAADFRQATCRVSGDDLVLLDFDTAGGQRAWLDSAEAYGGVYLVGERWALSGKSKEYLESLTNLLGGTVEVGAHGAP